MQMFLDQLLRDCVLADASISAVARGSGVPQATLQEFAVGKPDGTFADLRLSSAQKLMEYFGIDGSLQIPRPDQNRRRRMLLAEELAACDCPDSPEKFKERLIDGLMQSFPGRTIDGLVCEPMEALKFCDLIRQGVGSESMADVVILKSLMNIRRRKDCPVGLKPARTQRFLKNELADCGCEIPPKAFRELLVNCLADMYKSRTIDELLCHPREAGALCNYIRRKADCAQLPDRLILSTLMNGRKSP